MISHPATKQQVMRKERTRPGDGEMGPGHSPAQNCPVLPTPGRKEPRRPFPVHILKNIQGQILFYPTAASIWVCTRLIILLQQAPLDLRSWVPFHSGKPFQYLCPRAHPCSHPFTLPIQTHGAQGKCDPSGFQQVE